MQELMEYRVRSKVSPTEMEAKVGRILQDDDFNIVMTGPTKMMLPSGEPLCIYLPGAISREMCEVAYPIVHPIRSVTNARSNASGSLPVKHAKQTRYRNVASSILGSIEPMGGGRYPFCRTTAWTGSNTEQFRKLYPLFETIAEYLKQYVPHRNYDGEQQLPHWSPYR